MIIITENIIKYMAEEERYIYYQNIAKRTFEETAEYDAIHDKMLELWFACNTIEQRYLSNLHE